jgi:hypothetical protein
MEPATNVRSVKQRTLVRVKLLHTVIWAVMAGSILAIPVTAMQERFDWAAGLSALVLLECGVLAVNRGRCPLTDVAARYTDRREENFDIYLPRWLARHNKVIFGALFVMGEVILLYEWLS